MIQAQTVVRICDNSGAKKIRCIKVLGGFKRSIAYLGNNVIGSIQYVQQHKKKRVKVKEGEISRGLIVRSRAKYSRKNSLRFRCCENAIVLLTGKHRPVATRVVGPVMRELRSTKYLRVASISSGVF